MGYSDRDCGIRSGKDNKGHLRGEGNESGGDVGLYTIFDSVVAPGLLFLLCLSCMQRGVRLA